MTPWVAPGARFTVTVALGHRLLPAYVRARLGTWNSTVNNVYPLDLSRLRRPGTYRVRTAVGAATFQVGSAARLRGPAALAAGYFTGNRDGAHVVAGELRRRPAHLNDRHAQVYDWPKFTGSDTDEVAG